MKAVILPIFVLFLFFGCATNEPMPRSNCITYEQLVKKEFLELKKAREELMVFKNEYASLSSYILFLNNFGVDYSKYQTAISGLSNAFSYMPIPYAGQISSAANFGIKITALASETSKNLTALNEVLVEFDTMLAKCEAQISSERVDSATLFAKKIILQKVHIASHSLKELKKGAETMLLVADATKKQYESAAAVFDKITGPKRDGAEQNRALKNKNDSFRERIDSVGAAFERASLNIQNAAFVSKIRGEARL